MLRKIHIFTTAIIFVEVEFGIKKAGEFGNQGARRIPQGGRNPELNSSKLQFVHSGII